MEEVAELLAELLRGTGVENNELELNRLSKLSPKEQLEVGLVLREAMQQGKMSPEHRQAKLMRVRTVEEALSYLNSSESDKCSTRYV
jgi:hypothetical protein